MKIEDDDSLPELKDEKDEAQESRGGREKEAGSSMSAPRPPLHIPQGALFADKGNSHYVEKFVFRDPSS